MNQVFSDIPSALKDMAEGKPIILVDDDDRENEGDIVVAADKITPEAINFMAKNARGLICLALPPEDIARLQLPMMAKENHSKYETAFTVSIEAAHGVTTGISAFDRAHTIKVAADPNSSAQDIVIPGHIFPLRAREGGVLFRSGHTEGSVDLARLAGCHPAAAICEVMREDGHMARMPDLQQFAKAHDMKLVSINDVIAFRMQNECLIEELAQSQLPLPPHGQFAIKVFRSVVDNAEHVALIKGDIDAATPTLVRVHSECLTGDVFHSGRCDCGWQLHASLAQIGKEGGVLLYMSQEGRGIGLANKIKAYALQDQGLDTVEANIKLGFSPDHRNYGIGSQILRYLGIGKMRLLTNNPRKIHGISGYGLEIVKREPIMMDPTADNIDYLTTKQNKLGHLLSIKENIS